MAAQSNLATRKFNLALIDHKDAQVSDLFSQFHRFGDGFLLSLLTAIFVTLWTLLLIIPGIIAGYSYAMAPYILYEHPGLRPMDAIKASKELMQRQQMAAVLSGAEISSDGDFSVR